MTRAGKNTAAYSQVAVRSKRPRHSADHRMMKPYDKVDDRHTEDAYWTPPIATRELLRVEDFSGPIWEPACGKGHISRVLEESGFQVFSSDKYDWGYGVTGVDFLQPLLLPRVTQSRRMEPQSIISNAPYRLQIEFLRRCEELQIPKFAWLMRLQYLEGKERWKFYSRFHVNVHIMGRLPFEVNGTVRRMIPYAWFVFDLTDSRKRVRCYDLQGWRRYRE